MLSEVGVVEFAAHFNKLTRPARIKFAKERQSEILALRNADIFDYLCTRGFFNYMAALFDVGDEEQTREAFIRFYGDHHMVWLKPSRDDEKRVIIAAAKRMELIRFLREETIFFWSNASCWLRNLLYENASRDGLDYLFLWAIRNYVSVSKISGLQLFGRASAHIIQRYISKVAFFSGGYAGLHFSHIKALYEREDLPYNVKMELIFAAVNHFRVSANVITQMRKAGMFG